MFELTVSLFSFKGLLSRGAYNALRFASLSFRLCRNENVLLSVSPPSLSSLNVFVARPFREQVGVDEQFQIMQVKKFERRRFGRTIRGVVERSVKHR